MSLERCSVCDRSFDPEINDLAIFEPKIICGSCVQNEIDKVLANYFRLARRASYHYADDSGKELGAASTAKHAALVIFDAYPELHKQMRAERELWSLEKERPVENN